MAYLIPISSGLSAGLLLWMLWSAWPQLVTPADKSIPAFERYPWLGQIVAPFSRFAGRYMRWFVARLEKDLLKSDGSFPLSAEQLVGLGILLSIVETLFLSMMMSIVIAVGISIPVFTFVMPIAVTRQKRLQYTKRLDRQFPYFLEFIVMVKEAGETLSGALKLYVKTAGDSELSRAMTVVADGIARHKDGLKGALMEFHDRCPSEDGCATIRAIIKSEEMGARSTAMLRDIANDMRARRYEAIEKEAEKLKSKSNGPAFLMFAAAIVMLLAGSMAKLFNFGG